MVRKSKHLTPRSRQAVLGRFYQAVPAYQDATDEVDEAAARVLGVNRTDLRCLSVLSRAGSLSPSRLADEAGLTRGAMTTALDRLETAGLAERSRDDEDRRGVRVSLTDLARRRIATLWGPIAAEGSRILARYSTKDLEVVLRFLEEGRSLQELHARRIRDLVDSPERVRRLRKTSP
jgi:DNA-binding MarR family transcriptional regulator